MTTQVDIFVCGAGPAGLFFAYQTVMAGHSVYICDSKSGPTKESRAMLITARSMETLEAKGLAADILSEAYLASGMRMYKKGKVIAHVDACGDTPFPHPTSIPQLKTEEIIYNRLENDTDCRVNWKTELMSYTQYEDKVVSIVKNLTTNQEETIESKYIVGADGSHSRVRKGNPDWTYEGATIQTKFALADLTVQEDNTDIHRIDSKMNVFINGANVLGMIPLSFGNMHDNKNTFRIFGNLDGYNRLSEDQASVTHGLRKDNEPPTLEFLQEMVDSVTAPIKFKLSDIIWSSYFSINERVANGYRRNRAFLVGDAAHCHSPFGGQGMNLGLQDAANLAWKMSNVLNGNVKNPEELLDSYSEERIPHAKSTLEATSNATQAALLDNPLANSLRSTVISTALMIPKVREIAFKTILQLKVVIDPKESKILGVSDKGLIQAGEFLPETGVLRKSFASNKKDRRFLGRIERNTLRELLIQNDKYAAIFVTTCSSGATPSKHLVEKFWKDTEGYPIKRLIIQSAWHSNLMRTFPDYITDEDLAEESFYSEENMDVSNSVTQRIGLYPILSSYFAPANPSSVMLIVRPDMYVAQAKLINSEEDLDNSLEFIYSTLSR